MQKPTATLLGETILPSPKRVQAHEYCRQLESAAFRYCEQMNIDAHELVEGSLPFIYFRRWQIVAEDLLLKFSLRHSLDEAEMLREIGYQYILDYGNTSVRTNMLH